MGEWFGTFGSTLKRIFEVIGRVWCQIIGGAYSASRLIVAATKANSKRNLVECKRAVVKNPPLSNEKNEKFDYLAKTAELFKKKKKIFVNNCIFPLLYFL